MQLDHQGNLVQNSLLKPGSKYKQHLCALHGTGEFSCYATASTPCLTAARLGSKCPLFLFTVGFFLLWSQAVSASSVTGVGWCISDETEVAEMKVFRALNFCRVQSAAPSFLMDNFQKLKILQSRWHETPIFLCKIAEWIWKHEVPAVGQLTQGSWLEAEHQESSETSVQQPCTLQVSSEIKTTSGHKQGTSSRSGWRPLGLWGVVKISDFSVVWSKNP